ncbi:MAG: Na(+)/H(+) antiporter subunit D [Pirellulaceae bacterium]
MINNLPPGLIMIAGALIIPFLPRVLQAWMALLLSLTSAVVFLLVPDGTYGTIELFDVTLTTVRIDTLSRCFALVFHIAAIVSSIYALHVRDTIQHVTGMLYAGGAIAACCAGDLITLFVFWELTAISSVFLIWASRNEPAYRAGMRYLIIQVGSGVLLLSGAILHYVDTGSLAFVRLVDPEKQQMSTGVLLIFLAFGIKCAFPLMHNWLQDSYPKATVTGTVFLSAFTTKLAVYSLARGFAGTEILIWIGVTMTLFPILFAVIENDLRKVLAYSLNNQLGFMVVGIGIGTELAINGTVAHAFCHIIYKALLFMSMGAVLFRTGTCKATELGGLHKSMPLTTIFCIIGAGSIAGFPLLSGFISKSMIITAAAEEHMLVVWVLLLVASAGVMEHSGIKIPFFAFFAHDSGRRVKEAPWNMLLAMGLASAMCIGLGIGYQYLYNILPYDVHYEPYTVTHVVTQFQLLLFAALAFVVLIKTGVYPEEMASTNLDSDWVYRRLLPAIIRPVGQAIATTDRWVRNGVRRFLQGANESMKDSFSEQGAIGRTWTTGAMAVWATVILGLCLLLYYL